MAKQKNRIKKHLHSLRLWLSIKRNYLSVVLAGNPQEPRLKEVAIEINSACNRKCAWCPNHNNDRENVFMDEKIFYQVIDELKEMNFKGKLTFNQFNEPLLDKRLVKFIEYTRKTIPSTYIYINTNGDLLTLELWKQLREAGLNFALISQYDNKINKKTQRILDQLDPKEKKAFFARVFDTETLSNWAGLIETKDSPETPLKEFCQKPFKQLQINYKGKVVLCCRDYFGQVEIGDVTKDSIKNIWVSKKMKHYRKRLLKGDRASLKLCKSCI